MDNSGKNGDTTTNGTSSNSNGYTNGDSNHTKPSAAANAFARVSTVQPFASRLFSNDNSNSASEPLQQPKKNKLKQIAQWPHDDYHEVQTRYYQVVDSAKLQDEPTPSYVHRPAEMPDIPTAVQNLPLVEFESAAQDRAIGIVSTWIFDAGLIDELLLETTSTTAHHHHHLHNNGGGGAAGEGYDRKSSTGKMDKEIVKLREQTERDLALINNRLNDGVASSGSEVQELVNAVEATKSDLVRLGELATCIANGGDAHQKHSFLLTNYPKLKTAIHARRNLARCFRELDFFSQIPITCTRLREELNACEWTDHEWSTIRSVCREHVELQIFLVEAEAGMKARLDEEAAEEQYDHNGRPTRGMRKNGNSFRYAPTRNNHESVDRFLNAHVQNVWEVGDEIRLRVLSGIGTALDLSTKDPSGMVALVEAVEVYESATDEYRRVHGGLDPTKFQTTGKHRNAITDMRSAALEQIADDFQTRAEDQFNTMITKATDGVGQGDYVDYERIQNAEFNAVLRASQDLTNQISLVKQYMTPCFPPFWNVETLWMTCVASVCSENILRNIGGQEGNDLGRMTVTQLLDLVAWIESFREKVDETFPNLIEFKNQYGKKTQFTPLKELMKGKEIDMKSAKENLSWVTSVLWGVKEIAQQKFIDRTNDQTAKWLDNVYAADHAKSQTVDGHLITSLPEDVFALAGVQLRTIRERLTKKSSVLVDAVTMVFIAMMQKQSQERDRFLLDLETSCAAANDFYRMQDQCDEVVEELLENTDLAPADQSTVQEMGNQLTIQYANDAAYAAQSVHRYIFEPIEEELGEKLFSQDWEPAENGADGFGPMTDFALTIVRTIEDFMTDIEEWMEGDMVRKLFDGLVRASINFYIKNLLLKAGKKGKDSIFRNNKGAVRQISHDIEQIRSFFQRKTQEWPPFQRVINAEFEIVKDIFGLFFVAANDGDDPDSFFPGIQKKIKDVNICRGMIGDLYHLVAPDKERDIYEIFARHEEDLRAFEMHGAQMDSLGPDLQLSSIVREIITEGKRRRPIKGEALKSMEKAFGKWGFGPGAENPEEMEEQPEQEMEN